MSHAVEAANLVPPPPEPEPAPPSGSARLAAVLLRLLGHSWIALVLAFAASAPIALGLIALAGADPLYAAMVVVDSTVGTVNGIVNTLVYATPRLFVALGAIIALRAGLFNLGGEGQLQFGAVGAIIGAYYGGTILPEGWGLVAGLVGALLLGGMWAGLAVLFKLWRGTDEMIVTLLMNFVATYFVLYLLQGPLRADGSSYNQSERIPESAQFPTLFGTRLHIGVLIALVLAVLVSLLLSRTRVGLELRSTGLSQDSSRFQGLPIRRLLLIAMIVSGALAGLAGANEVLGTQYRLISGFSSGFGFEGLAIAFLARLSPARATVLALVFGGIYSSAVQLQQSVGVSASIAYVVEGIPIILLASITGIQMLMSARRGG